MSGCPDGSFPWMKWLRNSRMYATRTANPPSVMTVIQNHQRRFARRAAASFSGAGSTHFGWSGAPERSRTVVTSGASAERTSSRRGLLDDALGRLDGDGGSGLAVPDQRLL